MENDINIISDEKRKKAPPDIRIVPYYFYLVVFCRMAFAVLLLSGVARPAEPHRVLFGTVALSNSLSYGVFELLAGFSYLLCAWGLVRRVSWAWWLTLLTVLYSSTDAMLIFPKYTTTAVSWITMNVAIIAWLWFRKRFYGIGRKGSKQVRRKGVTGPRL